MADKVRIQLKFGNDLRITIPVAVPGDLRDDVTYGIFAQVRSDQNPEWHKEKLGGFTIKDLINE